MDVFSFKTIVDLIIVGVILFKLASIIKGTRAMNVFLGLIIFTILFALAGLWDLSITKKILSYFFDHLVLIVIILFQEEIRRTLASVGRRVSAVSNKKASSTEEIADYLSRVCFQMSQERLGGLIILEREDKLNNIIETGSPVFSKVRPEIIYSFFLHKSPLHDGAVIISNGEIVSAGSILPLSKNPNLSKSYGTRHRAGMGLSEESDALVIVISEETGKISIMNKAQVTTNLSQEELKEMLVILQEEGAPESLWVRFLSLFYRP